MALSRWIREAAAVKPIIGIARESAYSAGYALLSGCSEAYVTPDGGVGSIGVILVHANQAGLNEKLGVQYTIIHSGARKADFSPHAALSDEAIERLQTMVDDGRQRFAEMVAAHRGLGVDKVLATEAGLYFGQDAVKAGLVDGVLSWEETVARMRELMAGRGNSSKSAMTAGAQDSTMDVEDDGMSMTVKERFAALLEGNAEEAPAALAELGYVKAAEAEAKAREEGTKAGLAAGLAQAVDVVQACRLGGIGLEPAEQMIGKGLDGKGAAQEALALKAAASGKEKVNSTITDGTRTGKHPLVAECEGKGKRGTEA